MTIAWHLFDARSNFPAFTARWAALNERLFGGHPLLDPLFVGPLLECFGKASTQLAVLGDPADPQAMLLLVPGRVGVWRAFLPSQAQIAPVLLARHDRRRVADLLRALPGRALALDLLAQDPLHSALVPAEEPDPLIEVRDHVRTISVALDGGFERYWSARSRTLTKNIRRYGHRLERDGIRLDFEVATHPQQVAARVLDYGRLESAGWKRRNGTAVSPDNVQGRFYSAVMQGFAQRGDARVYSLLHDGRPVSSRLVVHSARMFVILKTTYDESYAQYAPGRLLLQAVLRDLFGLGEGRVVEFYTNATSDQMAWATGDRMIANVRQYRSGADRWMFERTRAARELLRRIAGRRSPAPSEAADDALAQAESEGAIARSDEGRAP